MPAPAGSSVSADLLMADRGTTFYGDLLTALNDAQFDEPSLLPGWDRRHVIAHVGYNARALRRLVTWASTGVETPMYASAEARNSEIDEGSSLPPAALRELHRVELTLLTAAWQDLPADRWEYPVRTAQGRTVPVSTTAWMRVREVWLHGVDLGNGGRFEDFPADVVDRLLVDITTWWAGRGEGAGLTLVPTDRAVTGLPAVAGLPADEGDDRRTITVTGTAAQLARWASGRGADGVTTSTGEPVGAPRWL